MYNKPRRPYYDWSSNDMPKAEATPEHNMIDPKRFRNLWRQLLQRKQEARDDKAEDAKSG